MKCNEIWLLQFILSNKAIMQQHLCACIVPVVPVQRYFIDVSLICQLLATQLNLCLLP